MAEDEDKNKNKRRIENFFEFESLDSGAEKTSEAIYKPEGESDQNEASDDDSTDLDQNEFSEDDSIDDFDQEEKSSSLEQGITFQLEKLKPEAKLNFASNLTFAVLVIVVLLVSLKALISTDAMDEAFTMVIPSLLSIVTAVVVFYFGKKND